MFYEGCTIDEIKAFRELESETFDFGEGFMKIEDSFGSEDVYYKLALQEKDIYIDSDNVDDLHNQLSQLHEYNNDEQGFVDKSAFIQTIKGLSRVRHHNKLRYKRKLNNLDRIKKWWAISERDGYKIRRYRDKKSSKRVSNKKIRKTLSLPSGGHYKRTFDFWDEIHR